MNDLQTYLHRPYIFLSYSHDDREAAEWILNALQARGFVCWIDHDRIRGNEHYLSKIYQAVENCSILLACFSRSYVSKEFCAREYDTALEEGRRIQAVCLDDITRQEAGKRKYMFSTFSGYNIPGYGQGIDSREAAERTVDSLIQNVPFQVLKQYYAEDRREKIPPITLSEHIFNKIVCYHETMYTQLGNYHLGEIHAELFPALEDPDVGRRYRCEGNQEVSLNQYLDENPRQHILLLGEGGMGKTVSMLKATEHLLEQGIHAVYIPLHTIDFRHRNGTLKDYLIDRVFGGSRERWSDVERFAKEASVDRPNLVLLLDGVNEVDPDEVEQLLRYQIRDDILRWPGTQVVLSSRFDFRSTNNMESLLQPLTLQDLEDKQILQYIQKLGLEVPHAGIMYLLRNPLRLTLYADAEAMRAAYDSVPGIELDYPPDSPGKIMGNYIKTQIFRAGKDNNSNVVEYLVLLEYALPCIAYKMVCRPTFTITRQEIIDTLMDCGEDTYPFSWYTQDRMHQVCSSRRFRWNALDMLHLATASLHFLNECKTDSRDVHHDGRTTAYEFLHQSFRDFFASVHLANEMQWLCRNNDRLPRCNRLMERKQYPLEILAYVADITSERNAQPRYEETGLVFPGKTGLHTPSSFSIAEQLLKLWRGQEGPEAQNAVYNLLMVMSIGRKRILAWCDFSGLDLRRCKMNGCHFVEWYRDEIYASSFDGAWIDRTFLLTNGHAHTISAICTDGEDLLFTADQSGVIKFWSISEGRLLHQLQLQNDKVQDLVWNSRQRALGIAYRNIVFLHNLTSQSTQVVFANAWNERFLRYIRFAEDDSLQIAYYDAPLTWYDTDGVKQTDDLDYDVATRCAKRNPVKKQFVRSYLQQNLQLCEFDEKAQAWILPDFFREKQRQAMEAHHNEHGHWLRTSFFPLRFVGAEKGLGVASICYHPDGTRFLLTIQQYLIEFSAETFAQLRSKRMSENIFCACYGKDDSIYVGSRTVYILNSDLTERIRFPKARVDQIRVIIHDSDQGGLYLLSNHNEIKYLDEHLRVKRMRRHSAARTLLTCRDRLTNEKQFLFTRSANFPDGARYTFETNHIQPLGWRYEALDQHTYHQEDSRVHKLTTSLISVDTAPPYNTLVFDNYSGVWIFDCSFRNIKGEMATGKHQQFLYQNGGLIDE